MKTPIFILASMALASCGVTRGNHFFHDNVEFGSPVTVSDTLTVTGATSLSGNMSTTGSLSVAGGLTSPHSYASSGTIAAGKVVMKNESDQFVIANAKSRFAKGSLGVSAAAASGNVVSVYDMPGSRFSVSGTSANKVYYLSTTDGALAAESAIDALLANTIAYKIRVGHTDNANYFILDPRIIVDTRAAAVMAAEFGPSGSFLKVGSGMEFLRASLATYFRGGVLYFAGVDQPRVETDSSGNNLGLLIEQAATNRTIHSRDMSNAAWTKTNMTCVRNAAGLDGVASTATTCTATANDATVNQDADGTSLDTVIGCYSVYMKRLTGTGAVTISGDGTTYSSDLAGSINSSTFTRVEQNLASAVTGNFYIKLAVDTDAVILDFAQSELCVDANGLATSPIWTEAAAATRAADRLRIFGGQGIGSSFSVHVNARQDQARDIPAEHACVLCLDGGTMTQSIGGSPQGLLIIDSQAAKIAFGTNAGFNPANIVASMTLATFEDYVAVLTSSGTSGSVYNLATAESDTNAIVPSASQMLDSGNSFIIGDNGGSGSNGYAPYMHVKEANAFGYALSAGDRAYILE